MFCPRNSSFLKCIYNSCLKWFVQVGDDLPSVPYFNLSVNQRAKQIISWIFRFSTSFSLWPNTLPASYLYVKI